MSGNTGGHILHSLPVSRQGVLKQHLGRRQQRFEMRNAFEPAGQLVVHPCCRLHQTQQLGPSDQRIEVRLGLQERPESALSFGRRTENVAPVTQTAAVEVDFVLVEGWRQHVSQRREHPVFPRVSSVPPLASSRSSGRAAPSRRSM